MAQEMRDLLDVGIEVGVRLADERIDGGPVDLRRGLIDEDESAVPVFHENQTRVRVDDLPQQALLATQRFPLARAPQGFEHGGAEPDEPVLQDVIGRAALQIPDCSLFIERSGDKNERHIRSRALRELERFPTAESGDVVIAEDDVRRKTIQRRGECRLSSHVLDRGLRREARELTVDQHCVIVVVLDHEHANLFHATGLVMLGIVSVGGRDLCW